MTQTILLEKISCFFYALFISLTDSPKQHRKIELFLYSPILLALGIGAYFTLPFEPPIIIPIFTALLIYCIHKMCTKQSTQANITLAILIINFGVISCIFRTQQIHTPITQKHIKFTMLRGDVEAIELLEDGQGSRVTLTNLDVEKIDKPNTPRKLRLRLRHDSKIKTGQRIEALASLRAPSDAMLPGGFNFRRYLYFQGYGGLGFIYKKPKIINHPPNSIFKVQVLRDYIAKKITNNLQGERASVALALIIGQKNALSDDNRSAIRDAGLAHMLAISGLHVGLVASTLFFMLRISLASVGYIALQAPIKKIAAIFAFSGALFYMLIAGSTIPTQRAVLMISIVFLAIILDRTPISMRIIAFSALIVLAISPESLISVSFQMSFSAVVSLVLFYEKTKNIWSILYNKQDGIIYKISLYFLSVLITTIIASIATAPFSLYHFGQVSFMGSAANIIAVPLLAFIIMPFALLSLIAMPLGLEYYPFLIMGQGISHMLEIAHWFSEIPYAIYSIPLWNFHSFILLIISALWAILGHGRIMIIGTLMCLSASFITAIDPKPHILINNDHKLIMFHHIHEQLYTSNKSNSSFVREKWEKALGHEIGSSIAVNYKGGIKRDNSCQEEGCRFIIQGRKVSYVRHPYILKEECGWADILISDHPIKINCRANIKIDKFDTWEWGAHAIFIHKDKIDVRTSRKPNNNRPWSINRRGTL